MEASSRGSRYILFGKKKIDFLVFEGIGLLFKWVLSFVFFKSFNFVNWVGVYMYRENVGRIFFISRYYF